MTHCSIWTTWNGLDEDVSRTASPCGEGGRGAEGRGGSGGIGADGGGGWAGSGVDRLAAERTLLIASLGLKGGGA